VADAAASLVEVDRVSKSFGDTPALVEVSLEVPAGQICGLLGPNGAGKTTLFRLLMGILEATQGSLRVDGRDAFQDRVAVKRLVGFLPDEPVGAAYAALLERLPLGEGFRTAADYLAQHPGQRWWLALAAVAFAPLAEEYLFRGLLYRALDREWGGARAVWGSAAFFAIYHPPLAWPPVLLVGAASAVLFKRSGHLAPSVLLHLAYNAIVVWAA
jgi:membrane protease YdiL (CAAX protease family)